LSTFMAEAEVTRLLNAAMQGDEESLGELLPLVYETLRRLARGQMGKEGQDHTLQATALVHEAYLRMVGKGAGSFESRRHFFGAAAEAMRRILIEHARRGRAIKYGGGRMREPLVESRVSEAARATAEDLLALNDALKRLAAEDGMKAELVQLCYFGGLNLEEAAVVLGLSRTTAYRHWRYARAWLHDAMTRGEK